MAQKHRRENELYRARPATIGRAGAQKEHKEHDRRDRLHHHPDNPLVNFRSPFALAVIAAIGRDREHEAHQRQRASDDQPKSGGLIKRKIGHGDVS